MGSPYVPMAAEVVDRVQEAPNMFTLRLRLVDGGAQRAYQFQPGQFNMVYLYGVGEIPISIVSDPEGEQLLAHAIRSVGRVSNAMALLKPGDTLGIRGPFGRGWPLLEAEAHDVLLVTGGLGCAPVVSVITYILKRRERYRRLTILQGVKRANDLIWREQYEKWASLPETQVLLAADVAGPVWRGAVGPVTVLFERMEGFDPQRVVAMMCGPEAMMRAASKELLGRGVPEDRLWVSLERNMQCGRGHCGHCQIGRWFLCKDGPVFNYPQIKSLFGIKGF